MAKKSAPKKKSSPAKAAIKPAKKSVAKAVVKTLAKKSAPVKKSSPAKAATAKASLKPIAKAAKPLATAKPAMVNKKGKAIPVEVEEDLQEPKFITKNQTVVSMLESDSSLEESSKAEKVSKIKPVKIERGNLSDEKAKWVELNKKYGKEKAVPYKMSDKFPTMTPMQHKVLGWGFILTNENDRLEVLFETGIRMLISNYKS